MNAQKRENLLNELYGYIKEVTTLGGCIALLDWDERVYMPHMGSENRGNQVALLAGIIHDKFTSPRVGDILNELIADGLDIKEDTVDSANVRELKRAYDKQFKIPKSLIEEISRTATRAQGVWQDAREKSDFAMFQPWMEKMVGLKRQQAEAVGYVKYPYNALLDDFEQGASTDDITKVFAGLRDELVDLIAKIKNSGKSPDTSIILRDYPVERQAHFGTEAAKAIGYDLAAGRIDITAHPFCTTIGPGDVRITTRYNPNHFPQAFFGIMHETGHAMYDQGLPIEHHGTPCGETVSLGIHESQSRMWENLVGRSRAFWKHFYPKAQALFPEALKNISLDQFYFAINDVRPSMIRIEADEATYNLHILLRFEMETAFFHDEIKISDVPAAWNEKFKKYFGLVPKNDAEGCLQDVHWSAGLIGYFPTYTLGNLYSAQFYETAQKSIGNLDDKFARGDFSDLLKWLRENIHQHGQRYRPEQLVMRATGKPLSHQPLMNYLKTKFGELYGI